MEKVKVTWAPNYGTAQIYSKGVELALCSDDNKQIGPFVYCKDFFQDAIVVFLHGGNCQVYGYKYDPKAMPPCPQETVKVLLANAGDKDMAQKIAGVADLLNQIEKILDVNPTTVAECESPPDKYKNGIYLLTGDKKWLLAPPLISMWTLLARNGLQHKVGENWLDTVQKIIDGKTPPAQTNDKIYLTYAKPGIELLLTNGFTALFGTDQKANYPIAHAGTIMHHYSGAVSFGSCKAKKYFPNWKYPAVETNPPAVCFA